MTKTVTRELILKNNSEVPAEFHIDRRADDGDFDEQFFGFSPDRGSIPSKMSFSVKVNYSPGFADTKTTANFKIKCDSGNEIGLSLRGHSHRFRVNFNTNSINFG